MTGKVKEVEYQFAVETNQRIINGLFSLRWASRLGTLALVVAQNDTKVNSKSDKVMESESYDFCKTLC